jgi:hypothetical protein
MEKFNEEKLTKFDKTIFMTHLQIIISEAVKYFSDQGLDYEEYRGRLWAIADIHDIANEYFNKKIKD